MIRTGFPQWVAVNEGLLPLPLLSVAFKPVGEAISNLALRYLKEHGGLDPGVERTAAMEKLQQALHLDAGAATRLLWATYPPWRLWIPFAAIGVASSIGIAIYARWVRRYEAKDV